MKLVDLQEWRTRSTDVTAEFLGDRTQPVNLSALSGEGYDEWVVSNARGFKSAGTGKSASRADSAAMFVMSEGRHLWPKYSNCADLGHVCLSLAGVRIPKFVNRDDDDFDGTVSATEKKSLWVVSQNVSLLIGGAQSLGKELGFQAWVPGESGILPGPGRIFVVGGDGLGGEAHVGIVETQPDEFVESIDGGQVDDGGQCVKRVSRKVTWRGKRPWFGSRGMLGFVDAPTVLWELGRRGRLSDPRVITGV